MDVIWERIFSKHQGQLHRYLDLVGLIEQAIVGCELQAGDRLPTQREIAKHLSIAIGTVTRAYSEIERRGLVVGKVGSGTFVSSFARQQNLRGQSADNPPIVDMTTSRPPTEGAALYLANALRVLSKRRDIIDLLGTEPPNGWLRHRIAAAKWISRRIEAVQPGQIIMCNGVQHALSTIFAALTKAGDVIATEDMNYPGIKLLADLHRIRLVGVSMDNDGLRADRLEQLCTRMNVKFVLCSPTAHNPTTINMSLPRRLALIELARKHNFLLIENDILGMMPVEQRPSLHSLAPHGTIYVTGLSKVIAAGMRVGFIVASASLLHPLMSGVRSTTWMPQPLILEIFAVWMDNHSIDEIIAWHRQEISIRLAMARNLLGTEHMRFDPGSYHVWLALPAGWTSDEFVDQAHARGVSLSPSDTFAINVNPAPNAARISLGAPNSRETLAGGLAILASLLREPPS